MKRVIGLILAVALLGTIALGSDKDKKEEKKPDATPVPVRLSLTPTQAKALEEIEQQFQKLQEEAQKQAQILAARENGMVTAFAMGTKLEGKQYKLVKDKDGYAVEEVIAPPPAASPSPTPTPSPSAGGVK